MGADLIMTTWFTSNEVDMKTVLEIAEFEKRLKTVIEQAHIEQITDFADNIGLSGYWGGDDSDLENEKLVREEITGVLTDGYKELRASLTDFHRYITYTSIGEMTIWSSGGLSWGDDPWEGFNSLSAILNAPYYIDNMSTLIPWIITGSYSAKHEDTSEPCATGLITAYAASIMKHAAMTHPDPNVRASVVQNTAVAFTASELALLAQDSNTDVARAASDRVIDATLIDAREPFKE
jgi:hypothetical protein